MNRLAIWWRKREKKWRGKIANNCHCEARLKPACGVCKKKILKKDLEDADYYSLNDEYMRENKILDIVE